MGIFDVIRFKKGSSLSISILQHGLQEYTLQREDRNNEYSSCHFFNFYFEPKIQSGCMIVTCTVKIIIFIYFFLIFCFIDVEKPQNRIYVYILRCENYFLTFVMLRTRWKFKNYIYFFVLVCIVEIEFSFFFLKTQKHIQAESWAEHNILSLLPARLNSIGIFRILLKEPKWV